MNREYFELVAVIYGDIDKESYQMLGEKEALLLIWTKFCENVAKF
jgi:hypothetical protein